MKNIIWLATIVVSLSIGAVVALFWVGFFSPEAIVASSLPSQEQPAENEDWLEMFEQLLDRSYSRAVQDASVAEEAEISRDLWAITPDNPDIFWQNNETKDKVLLVTWTSREGYDDREGSEMELSRDVWTTVVPQARKFCQALTLDPKSKSLRLEQFLGLPPHDGKTKFVEIWAKPEDIFRPCPDAEINDKQCDLEFRDSVDPQHQDWMLELESSSYGEGGYPWTRLGYTYDWGNLNTEVGGSEFVIKSGATVGIEFVTTTEDYCQNK
ncbi:MAG: hypothetical protein J7647_28330 [Cyanobacteria bacterium SBLK]|nr:hypothetical protein [Cyanobacteria bacterium SBLK]